MDTLIDVRSQTDLAHWLKEEAAANKEMERNNVSLQPDPGFSAFAYSLVI